MSLYPGPGGPGPGGHAPARGPGPGRLRVSHHDCGIAVSTSLSDMQFRRSVQDLVPHTRPRRPVRISCRRRRLQVRSQPSWYVVTSHGLVLGPGPRTSSRVRAHALLVHALDLSEVQVGRRRGPVKVLSSFDSDATGRGHWQPDGAHPCSAAGALRPGLLRRHPSPHHLQDAREAP
jgi:hypothetical protein